MSLACGGRGPCCHIGYSHRHCEHCDVVIPLTVQPHTHNPWWQSFPYSGSIGGLYNSQFQGLNNTFQALQSAVEVSDG